MALEYQEQEDFRIWILSQNDPKKFLWTYRDAGRMAMQPDELGRKVVRFATEVLRAAPRKGDVWYYAQAKGLSPVFKIERDGEESFVDESGNEVEAPEGYFFVGSSHQDAQKLADEMRDA